MEKKEWYLSRWLVLYRCALEKSFLEATYIKGRTGAESELKYADGAF